MARQGQGSGARTRVGISCGLATGGGPPVFAAFLTVASMIVSSVVVSAAPRRTPILPR